MKTEIPDYYQYSLNLNEKEYKLLVSFQNWLPQDIIDCHAHSCQPENVHKIDDSLMKHMMTTFPVFTLDQSYTEQELLYPNKNIRTLRFAHAFRGIDHKSSNAFLLKNKKPFDAVALYGIPDDIDYTNSELRSGNYVGLKMYYQYFNPPSKVIYDFFKPEILEEAQNLDIPIILHLPKIVTECLNDVIQTVKDFPKLKIVLAHLGLPHYPIPGLFEAYKKLSKFEQIFMDTSLIPSLDVTYLAIKTFGINRIMYGSDEPYNLIKSKVYNNPDLGQRLITEYPYHWVDWDEHEKYKQYAVDIVHIHWQALSAIKASIEKMPLRVQEDAKQKIFYSNAKELFKFS